MRSLEKVLSTGVFAWAFAFAAGVSADATQGWGYKKSPNNVPTDIEAAIMQITNYILGFIIIVATLIVIYGGVLYLTAAGNDDQIAKAKSTISAGIIGIVICGLAYALVIVVSTVILKS